jgi:hypothetical protein
MHVLHFLGDILPKMSTLCKLYQSSSMTYIDVQPPLRNTANSIAALGNESNGEQITLFLSNVPKEIQIDSNSGQAYFNFEGHKIKDSNKLRNDARQACSSFTKQLVTNLETRFNEDGDSAIFAGLSVMFHPSLYTTESLDKFCNLLPTVEEYAASLCLPHCKDQFLIFRDIVQQSPAQLWQTTEDICQIAFRHDESLLSVSTLAKRLLTSPVSTVDVERGFSRVGLLKTELRNSLCDATMGNLLTIALEGPSEENFNFDNSFIKWARATERRIMK